MGLRPPSSNKEFQIYCWFFANLQCGFWNFLQYYRGFEHNKKSLHLGCIISRMSWDLRWTFNLVAFCMRIHYGDFFQSFFMKWKIGESHFLQVIVQVIWCTSFYNMWNQRCVVQAFVEQMKRVRSLFYFSSWEHHDMNIFCWILLLWP